MTPRHGAASFYTRPSSAKKGLAGSVADRAHELAHYADARLGFPFRRQRAVWRAFVDGGRISLQISTSYSEAARPYEVVARTSELVAGRHPDVHRAANDYRQIAAPAIVRAGAAPEFRQLPRTVRQHLLRRGLLHKAAPQGLTKAAPEDPTDATILLDRERIKRQTIQQRRSIHHQHAA
jgi:hypothetical protein